MPGQLYLGCCPNIFKDVVHAPPNFLAPMSSSGQHSKLQRGRWILPRRGPLARTTKKGAILQNVAWALLRPTCFPAPGDRKTPARCHPDPGAEERRRTAFCSCRSAPRTPAPPPPRRGPTGLARRAGAGGGDCKRHPTAQRTTPMGGQKKKQIKRSEWFTR